MPSSPKPCLAIRSAKGEGRDEFPIVLGGLTAVELLRSARNAGVTLSPASLKGFPERAPSRTVILDRLERLLSKKSWAACSRPVTLMIGSSARSRPNSLYVPSVSTRASQTVNVLKLASSIYVQRSHPALLALASKTRRLVDLLLLLWEACGTYQTRRTAVEDLTDIKPLVSVGSLARYCEGNPGVPGVRKVSRALKYVRGGSASVRETQLALMLGLPLRHGGCNLGLPTMNHRVEATPDARRIGGRSFYRCDLCWPEHRIDVEYQSDKEHAGESMRVRDSRRANALRSMGWTVVSVTNNEVESLTTIEALGEALRRAMGRRARRVDDGLAIRRLVLHRSLGIVDDGYCYEA